MVTRKKAFKVIKGGVLISGIQYGMECVLQKVVGSAMLMGRLREVQNSPLQSTKLIKKNISSIRYNMNNNNNNNKKHFKAILYVSCTLYQHPDHLRNDYEVVCISYRSY